MSDSVRRSSPVVATLESYVGSTGDEPPLESSTATIRPWSQPQRSQLPSPVDPSPGLGSITLERGNKVHVIDMATCRTRASHAVFSETQSYKTIGPGETPGPIVLLGWSGDDRWIFFAIDPGATHGKRLLVAVPPPWRPRPLVDAPQRAWGSLTCAPGRRSVVVQSQRRSSNPSFFATRWALWRAGLDGSLRRLTAPPGGHADESPQFSRDGRALVFVRSRKSAGRLYALRAGRTIGPLLSLGYSLGYYGHQDWWSTVRWSAGR